MENLGTPTMPRVILVSNYMDASGKVGEDRLTLTEYATPGGTKQAQIAYGYELNLLKKAVVSLDNGSNELAVRPTWNWNSTMPRSR